MSFILDALKKSESDRQRQSGPSLFEVKVAPPRRKLPIWAAAIAVLLGINIVVISWMLLRHPAAQEAAPASAAATSPATSPAAPPAAATPAAGAAPRTADRTASASSAASPSPATAATGPSAAHPDAPAGGTASTDRRPGLPATTTPGPGVAPLAGDADQSASQPEDGDSAGDYAPAVEPSSAKASGPSPPAAGDLPLYQQIATDNGMPALHLDLHVYADRPKDRFVMINMHRLGEGDSLPSGVQVQAIRPDGVVLSYRGTRFLLPRN